MDGWAVPDFHDHCHHMIIFCIMKTFKLLLVINMHIMIHVSDISWFVINWSAASIVGRDKSGILPQIHPRTVIFFQTPTPTCGFNLPNNPIKIRQTNVGQVQGIGKSCISCFTWWWSAIFTSLPANLDLWSKHALQTCHPESLGSPRKIIYQIRGNLSQFLSNRWIIRGW